LIDVLVERAECGTELGWCLGLVGGEERGEDAVVDLGVEDGEVDIPQKGGGMHYEE